MRTFLFIGGLVLSTQASAQKVLDLVITTPQGATSGPRLAPAQPTVTLATAVRRVPDEGLQLNIECRDGNDCAKVSADLVVSSSLVVNVGAESGATNVAASIRFAASRLSASDTSIIRIKLDQTVLTPDIRTVVVRAQTPTTLMVGTRTFACAEGFRPADVQPAGRELKTFVANEIGNVILRPPTKVDADDDVLVVTLGPSEDAGKIRIRRISAFGAPGQIDILGAGAIGQIERHAEGQCAANWTILGDFAPGKGEVELARVDEKGNAKTISTFDFAVDHLYTGAFSFGPVITGLEDRDYGVAGDTTIFETRNYRNGGRYVLAYTHFIRGRRNLDSPGPGQRAQLNPFIGIGTEAVFDNVMGGVALDLFAGSVFIHVGGHGGRVNTLLTSDSVGVGKKWRFGDKTLPIHKEWDWAWFGGLTVDLRAATQLFGKALTGGTD